MKKTKLWATGLSAIFLSTALLQGVANADTQTTTQTVADSAEVSALKEAIKNAENATKLTNVSAAKMDSLKNELKNANDLLGSTNPTKEALAAQTTKLKSATNSVVGENNSYILKAKTDAQKLYNAQVDLYNAIDSSSASASVYNELRSARTTIARGIDPIRATVEDYTKAADDLKTALAKFESAKAAEKALNASIDDLKKALPAAKDATKSASTNKVDKTKLETLNSAISNTENVLKDTKATKEEVDKVKTSLVNATTAVTTELTEKATAVSAIKGALDAAAAVKTDNKPTERVADFNKALANLKKINEKPEDFTKADIESAVKETKNTGEVVTGSGDVLKINAGSDQQLTVNFKTLNGDTVFPNGANKTTRTGTITTKGTLSYFEFNTTKDGVSEKGISTLQELVDSYKLSLPAGFELAEPNKEIKEAADVTSVTLKQKDKATFNQAYVTFKFTLNGKEIEAAGDSATFSSLQLTNDTINATDVIKEYEKKDPADFADFRKYIYKTDYTVDKKDKTFTVSNDSYHQVKTINFVKKPSSLKVVAKPYTVSYMSDVPSNQFKAGVKYSGSLISKLKIFANANSNELLDNKKYDIKIISVIKNSDTKSKPTNYVKNGSVVFPTANVNYRVKVSIAPKAGYGFTKTSAAAKTFSTTAYAKDSEPIISGVKDSTYSKSFSYTKGITAYDYVDKKNVKVTYKGKVTPSKPGKYKIYYYAKDSKGNVAKKTRTVTVK